MSFNTIEEIVEDLQQGKMIVLLDDEDRENEGDLIMAASKVTPAHVNFMITHCRGLLCMPMTQDYGKRLNLAPMAEHNTSRYHTNFTVSVEAARGVTTGISAADRATTIQAAVAPNANSWDLARPGHVFPILAQPNGVLERAGHTEAVCDLLSLAGLPTVGVLIEILQEDGTLARRPELQVFAEKHGFKIGTVAALVAYREKQAESELALA